MGIEQAELRFRRAYLEILAHEVVGMQGIGNDNNYKKKSETMLKQNIIPLTIIITHGVFAHNCFLQLFEPEKDVVFVDFGALTLAERRL